MEQGVLSHTVANAAAVTDDDDLPLVTMEPKDPAAEESVPAADECTKDPKRGFLSDETEIAPTGSFREVDTKETTTVEATVVEEDPVFLERKVDDSAGLIQVQEKKLGPDVEAGGQLGRFLTGIVNCINVDGALWFGCVDPRESRRWSPLSIWR